jgi:hypothetical protein
MMRKPQKYRSRITSLVFLLSSALLICLFNEAFSQGFLNISLYTSKQEYYLNEQITIYGNLTHLQQKVYDGIVALETISPQNKTIAIRVVSTGSVSQETYPVRIFSFYSSDSQGNPKNTFQKGTLAYFAANVTNQDIQDHALYFAVCIYDKYGRPVGLLSSSGSILAGKSTFILFSFPISYELPSGTAAAYAEALTAKPQDGGMPHCPEVKITFQIATSEVTPIVTSRYENGDFYQNSTMPTNSASGNYTIYATSIYQYSTATKQSTFTIKVPDLNNDGTVDIYDLIIVASAYGSTPPDPNWNPIADANGDLTVDIYDLILVTSNFGWQAP